MGGASSGDVEVLVCRVVGNRLKAAIRKKGLTREETARRARIMTTRQLWRIMKNIHCPSLERAMALSVVLGEPIEKLFKLQVTTRPVPPRPPRCEA